MIDNWQQSAACKGRTSDMFPTTVREYELALCICSTCPVVNQCLEYALLFPPQDMHGIWAGMDKRGLMREQMLRGKPAKKATYRQTVTLTEEER